MNLGLVITGSAVFLFIIYLVASHAYKRSHLAEEAYPEGDLLIEEWSKTELNETLEEAEEEVQESNDILNAPTEKVEELIPEHLRKYNTGFNVDTTFFKENTNESIDKKEE